MLKEKIIIKEKHINKRIFEVYRKYCEPIPDNTIYVIAKSEEEAREKANKTFGYSADGSKTFLAVHELSFID